MRAAVGRVEVGILCRDINAMAGFWAHVTGYKLGDIDSAGVYLDLVPPTAKLPVIFLQKADEYEGGPTRVHIDLYVEQLQAAVEEARAVGGSLIGDVRTGSEGGAWQIMRDPEGNEFCFCEDDPS